MHNRTSKLKARYLTKGCLGSRFNHHWLCHWWSQKCISAAASLSVSQRPTFLALLPPLCKLCLSSVHRSLQIVQFSLVWSLAAAAINVGSDQVEAKLLQQNSGLHFPTIHCIQTGFYTRNLSQYYIKYYIIWQTVSEIKGQQLKMKAGIFHQKIKPSSAAAEVQASTFQSEDASLAKATPQKIYCLALSCLKISCTVISYLTISYNTISYNSEQCCRPPLSYSPVREASSLPTSGLVSSVISSFRDHVNQSINQYLFQDFSHTCY